MSPDTQRGWGRWPHPPLFLMLLFGLFLLAVAVLWVRTIGYAFALAGISPALASVTLLASLLGSAVNIPVARLTTDRPEVMYRNVRHFGVVYHVPIGRPGRTTVALNVGGAIIPVAASIYLVSRTGLWLDAVIAVAVVSVVVHLVARPVPGLGIVTPALVPALVGALVALLVAPAGGAATLAYVAGTLGTLVGADLTNIRAIRRMRASMVSIGGAGTFDGVFLSGIIAVLIAAFF